MAWRFSGAEESMTAAVQQCENSPPNMNTEQRQAGLGLPPPSNWLEEPQLIISAAFIGMK